MPDIPQYSVKIADGSSTPQRTIKIADGSDIPQCTLKLADGSDIPQMTVKIADGSDVPQMTVNLLGYTAGIDYVARVQATVPVAYYPLNEASGTTAHDRSGNGHDGTVGGGVTFGATGIGDGQTAAAFTGASGAIDISAMAAAFSGARGTLLAWGKTSAWADATARYLARIAVNGTTQLYIQKASVLNQLTVRRQTSGGSKIVSDTSLAGASAFFCAALSWDITADQFKAYLNGAQVGTTLTGLAAWTGALTVEAIGAISAAGTSAWNGSIAHVALWDRALSDAEMLSLGVL